MEGRPSRIPLVEAAAGRCRWSLVVALLLVSGCSGEAPGSSALEFAAGASDGAPVTGRGLDPAEAARRERLVALAAEKRALLEESGASLAMAELEASPLLSAKVAIIGWGAGEARGPVTPRFQAEFRYRWTNPGATPLPRLAFEIPVNKRALGAGEPAPVRLTRVIVDGTTRVADGTAARWEIPVSLAPGGLVDLELVFEGEIPDARRAQRASLVDAELDALPALTRLLPNLQALGAEDVFGASPGPEGAVILAGVFPRPVGGSMMAPAVIAELEVELSPAPRAGALVAATGLPIRRAGGSLLRHRFVSARAVDLAVVVTAGTVHEEQAIAGRRLIRHGAAPVASDRSTSADSLDSGATVLDGLSRTIRRALETLDDRWGRLDATALTVVSTPMLDGRGVAALPGVIVLPVAGTPWAKTPGGQDLRADPGDPLGLPGRPDLLSRVLSYHPAPREAFERAVTLAIARQWWLGVGHGAAERVLEAGFGADGALAVIRRAHGDKAARRAIELGWRFPYQLERLRGVFDPRLDDENLDARSDRGIGDYKAGLAFEALARAMGDPSWSSLTRELLVASRRTRLDLASFIATLERHAPRPEVVRGLARRWFEERRGDTDVGELRPEVLLEYLVTDGAVGGLSQALLDNADELARSPLGKRAIERLGSGQGLDAGFAISLLGELIGPELDPTSRRWVELATGLFSRESRRGAVRGLVDEFGAELGIPESERSRLKLLGDLVFDALESPDSPDQDRPDEARPDSRP